MTISVSFATMMVAWSASTLDTHKTPKHVGGFGTGRITAGPST